ncbi:hypothetical protein HMPREF0492_0505 [Lactobacillus acidophilus ATCC 4796]|uniref:Uncharacterized protein n=1 Tax=Lactobacillus acidophilus (strain ATCC 700396 / NCK56 / N2 / NCFM) TaxID=272621 RepID=Q5FMN1_LACAC|nr:hypothetical protein LBA0142 [Lactobacillus acidophilus NCFM]AJP45617.1 hypothetical protein SD55_0139 [Lactobacillus acidophilus]EEJ76636.1 hypothetical protein HMPREF0492_0505 [Lactobacillus acidophilus ATCC 4796]CDF66943.1 Putative uncharacterized protein [Lactobacillus acidophilus DSM 20079 = JCM 1132 = NBRC 13951 = CIP 76.13]CDF68621.1 Putative uncharacterized protein [Lactobacillus acidophilus CIRM-BIA 442]CDF72378.1 Putative uncharacterized protein [Lactobacillus acidophilus CIRM-BIA
MNGANNKKGPFLSKGLFPSQMDFEANYNQVNLKSKLDRSWLFYFPKAHGGPPSSFLV